MKKIMHWVLAAILTISAASVFTSCSNNDDNPAVDDGLAEKVLGKWIHTDTDGSTYTITAHLKKVE